MPISADDVKKLREETGLGVMLCKRALEEAEGNVAKAMAILQKQGYETAAKKKGRQIKEGRVGQYVHHNSKIGVLVELGCETDFVADSDIFKNLLHDLCLQISFTSPSVVSRESLPAEEIEKHKDDPEYFKRVCLVDQPFIKTPEITIQQHIDAAVAQLKENIQVRRFARMQVGVYED
jgi:elongation factor Ts